jgi:hypothetical protein
MKHVEFLGYKPTPNDKYSMLGYATARLTVKLDDNRIGKFVVRYKHIKKKDGSGDFFAEGAIQADEENVKLYFLDSTTDNDELRDFIREKSKQQIQTLSALKPQSMDEVANDTMPF